MRHAPPVKVTFRFYEELNDFLPPGRRKREFDVACPGGATVKQMTEALGVAHTEVELILVNGESAGFDRRLGDGDRVAVYPMFESFDISPLLRVRDQPLRMPRFLADAHLGGLARLLRLLGFDTVCATGLADARIESLAREQGRIVLTRNRELLKRRGITHGLCVRTLKPRAQLREIVERLDLARGARPFSRCLVCNTPLTAAGKETVAAWLPPDVDENHPQFVSCVGCGRVYRQGSRWRRLRAVVGDAIAATSGSAA